MRHLTVVAACAVAALSIAGAASAAATRNVATLYVGHGAVGSNRGCSSPGYTSVQSAVDAASTGNKVYLCGARFAEQVFVSKTITLTGDATSGLTAAGTTFTSSPTRYPAQFTTDNLYVPKTLLVITGTHVAATVSGLTISGPITGNGGCAEQEFGVLVIGGANATLTHDTVSNIADSNASLYGCQFGVGIQIGREYWPTADFSTSAVENFVGTANIDHTTVSGYQKNGITVDGQGSKANVSLNTVTGGGRGAPFGAITAQNGIQISRGAGGTVVGNTVSNNSYTGPNGAASGGVLVFGGCGDPLTTNVIVGGNLLVNNDVGIYLNNYNATCDGPATTRTNVTASANRIENNAVTNVGPFSTFPTVQNYAGYQAGIDDIGNSDTVSANLISGAGYKPNTTPPGAFVEPVDSTSFPTIGLKNHLNIYRP